MSLVRAHQAGVAPGPQLLCDMAIAFEDFPNCNEQEGKMTGHPIYENLARVRKVSVGEALRLFPTIKKVQEAYGTVLTEIWSYQPLQLDN